MYSPSSSSSPPLPSRPSMPLHRFRVRALPVFFFVAGCVLRWLAGPHVRPPSSPCPPCPRTANRTERRNTGRVSTTPRRASRRLESRAAAARFLDVFFFFIFLFMYNKAPFFVPTYLPTGRCLVFSWKVFSRFCCCYDMPSFALLPSLLVVERACVGSFPFEGMEEPDGWEGSVGTEQRGIERGSDRPDRAVSPLP